MLFEMPYTVYQLSIQSEAPTKAIPVGNQIPSQPDNVSHILESSRDLNTIGTRLSDCHPWLPVAY